MQVRFASTTVFLLERSRIASIAAKERNYHVFYFLLRGIQNGAIEPASRSEKLNASLCRCKHLFAHPVEEFRILRATEDLPNTTVLSEHAEDVSAYYKLISSLHAVGVPEYEMEQLWRALACVLHLGNLICSREDGVVQNGSVKLKGLTLPVENVCELLGVDPTIFLYTVSTQKVFIRNRASINVKQLSILEVQNNIHALMKWIYSCVFSWLVAKINNSQLSAIVSTISEGSADISVVNSDVAFIGILDVFGFEIFEVNSLEQLLINYANEALLQQFNDHVFLTEQDLYTAEGITGLNNITYQNNQGILDLLVQSNGLFSLLEEHAKLNRKPDDAAVLGNFNSVHLGKNPAYNVPRISRNSFVIKHFAAEVTYNITNFIAKNDYSLQRDLLEFISTTSNPFLKNLLQMNSMCHSHGQSYDIPTANESPGRKGALKLETKKVNTTASSSSAAATATTASSTTATATTTTTTLSRQFRAQLEDLMVTLRATTPHYVKCIKPNHKGTAGQFESPFVMQQLRCNGIMEIIRIRQEGFPQRMSFSQFYTEHLAFCRAHWNWKKYLPPYQCDEELAKKVKEVEVY